MKKLDLTDLAYFVLDNPLQWHTYSNDKETKKLIKQGLRKGIIKVNDSQQMKLNDRVIAHNFLIDMNIEPPIRSGRFNYISHSTYLGL